MAAHADLASALFALWPRTMLCVPSPPLGLLIKVYFILFLPNHLSRLISNDPES